MGERRIILIIKGKEGDVEVMKREFAYEDKEE